MNAQQFILREYLRLLWRDSGFQQDWQAVRAGELDFHAFEQRWRLPRLLRRILLDASREPEEPSLKRLQEKIPAVEVSGFAVISPEGVEMEPKLPEKPLQALPEAEPSVETRKQYLARVKLLLQQERNFDRLLQQVEALPDPKQREAYLNALRGQEPRLLPEAQEKYPELAGQELEQRVLQVAQAYYESCLQAIRPRLTPKRFRSRLLNQRYLERTAYMLYLRVVRGWKIPQIQYELAKQGYRWVKEESGLRRECAYWIRALDFPSRKRGKRLRNLGL